MVLGPKEQLSTYTEYWDVPDTKDQSYEFKQMVRSEIKRRVEQLVAKIG